MTVSPIWIGIDVSKAWLDVAEPGQGHRLANRPGDLAAFATMLTGRAVTVVFEATGSYDADLRHALTAAGVAFVRINPQRARDFARATGRLAKTDAIDAAMLAEMGRALNLTADPPPAPERERLALLTRRRDQLVAMRVKEKTRRAAMADQAVADDLERHIAWLNAAIAEVEALMRSLVEASAEMVADEAILRTMPGVGPVTAAVLIGLMPELGRRPGKQLAMLAGLAPLNNDSGTRRGQRSIRGGRRRVRQALYMAAVAALTTNSPPQSLLQTPARRRKTSQTRPYRSGKEDANNPQRNALNKRSIQSINTVAGSRRLSP
jgi:transposase